MRVPRSSTSLVVLAFVLAAAAALSALLLSCLGDGTALCPSGLRCPEGTVCTYDGSGCTDSSCGNFIVEPSEQCDDGNVIDDATCSATCMLPQCGNGEIDDGETCDGPLALVNCSDYSSFQHGRMQCGADCKLDSSDCRFIDWEVFYPPLSESDTLTDYRDDVRGFYDVWTTPSGNMLAVGKGKGQPNPGGVIVRSAQPQGVPSAARIVTRTMTAVHGSGDDDIWAVGLDGIIYYIGLSAGNEGLNYADALLSDLIEDGDNGDDGMRDNLYSVWTNGPDDDVLMAGDASTLWRLQRPCRLSTSGGSIGTGPPCALAREKLPDADTGNDDNAKPAVRALWGQEDTYVAVGDSGALWLYRDGAWQRQAVSDAAGALERPLYAVWGNETDDIFAVGYGTILHYDGNVWSVTEGLPGLDSASLYGVWGWRADRVFAVGRSRLTMLYDGRHWMRLDWLNADPGLNSADLRGIWGPPGSGPIWMVGEERNSNEDNEAVKRIWQFAGRAWTDDPQPPTDLAGIWALAANRVYAVASRDADNPNLPVLLYFNGYGWSNALAEQPELADLPSLAAIAGTDDGQIYAVGNDSTILHYNGERWNLVDLADDIPPLRFRDLWVSPEGHVFVVAQPLSDSDGPAAVLRYDGEEWIYDQSLDSNFVLNAVWGRAADDVYVVGDVGTIRHFDGETWQIGYAGKGENLYDVWGNESGEFYAVGAFGTVLRYPHSDGQGGWESIEPVATLPQRGVTLHSIWGNEREIYIVDQAGATLLYFDGTTWSTMAQPQQALLSRAWGRYDQDERLEAVFFIGPNRNFRRLISILDR